MLLAGPAGIRDAMEIFVRQHALRQWAEGNATDAKFRQHIEQSAFGLADQHGVFGLVDEAGGAGSLQQGGGLTSAGRAVVRKPGVKCFAGFYRGLQGTHGFIQRGVGVGAMRIKNIHVIHPKALQALIQRGE